VLRTTQQVDGPIAAVPAPVYWVEPAKHETSNGHIKPFWRGRHRGLSRYTELDARELSTLEDEVVMPQAR